MSGDKLVRAAELMKLLSLEKSMKGAIKLVTALKLRNLSERFNTILEVTPNTWKKVLKFQRQSELVFFCYQISKTRFFLSHQRKDWSTNPRELTKAPS